MGRNPEYDRQGFRCAVNTIAAVLELKTGLTATGRFSMTGIAVSAGIGAEDFGSLIASILSLRSGDLRIVAGAVVAQPDFRDPRAHPLEEASDV